MAEVVFQGRGGLRPLDHLRGWRMFGVVVRLHDSRQGARPAVHRHFVVIGLVITVGLARLVL